MAETPETPQTKNKTLRTSLVTSQRESFASSLMTGSFDQYVNAFAVFLGANSVQIGWLTALPQLAGGVFQLLAVWIGQWLHRHRLIVVSAALQTAAILVVLSLALPVWSHPIPVLLGALILFHVCANLIMPHWRAWMGQLVPDKIRGRFFSLRSRIAMLTSFVTFIAGGLLLSGSEKLAYTWVGFFILFFIAAAGRGASTWLLSRMHDDETLPTHGDRRTLRQMFSHLIGLLADRDFRRFALFMAGMQCFVALSGPFFAVYMLRDLEFSYFQFAVSTGSSIFAQFLMLPLWGKICDRKGNRYVMAVGGAIIPILPVLWLFSDFYPYIICVQILGGFAWSGFTLAASNYLYDQKPRHVHFASYAAISSSMGALAVFIGALAGGYIIDWIPQDVSLSGIHIHIERPIAVIFLLSTLMRAAVALWYLPRAPELRIKQRGRVRDLVIRVARFTPISGVMIDVVNKRRRKTD
ncbi:MAG: MFS transporter [Reinekea sp.]|nr:MFS transporter [Reinekea sp.]